MKEKGKRKKEKGKITHSKSPPEADRSLLGRERIIDIQKVILMLSRCK